MPIEVINDAGSVLIDDNYVNFILAAKGAVELAATGAYYYVTFTYTSAEPSLMLALELSDIKVGHLASSRSGNTWTFTVHFNPVYIGRTLTYYVFTIPAAISDAKGIIQLRNAANQLTFDSNLKYMRVVGFYKTTLTASSVAAAMASDRSYAAISVMACWYNMHQRTNPLQYAPPYSYRDSSSLGLIYRSGNNLACEERITNQGNYDSDDAESIYNGTNEGRALVIDVTGF